jgi:hypothetical protein
MFTTDTVEHTSLSENFHETKCHIPNISFTTIKSDTNMSSTADTVIFHRLFHLLETEDIGSFSRS